MSARRVLPSLFLAFLLGASILAVQPTTAFPSTQAQRNEIADALGEDVPFGPLEVRQTQNRFWMNSAPTDANGFYNDANAIVTPSLDPAPSGLAAVAPQHVAETPATSNNRVARISAQAGMVARFPMPENLAAEDRYSLLKVDAKMLAACDVGNIYSTIPVTTNQAPTGITQAIIVQKQTATGWVDDRTISSFQLKSDGFIWSHERITTLSDDAPYSVEMFRGSNVEGDLARLTGDVVNPGERLLLQYSVAATNNAQCFLYYGALHTGSTQSCPTAVATGIVGINTCPGAEFSEITLTTDAARLAVYTRDASVDPETCGLAGQPSCRVDGFPSGAAAGPADRRIHVVALYASAFGAGIVPQLIEQRHANVRLVDVTKGSCPADPASCLYYVDNVDPNNVVPNNHHLKTGGFPREYEHKTIQLISSHADDLYPTPDIVEDLGHSVVAREYVFAYPETMTEELIEPQFYSFSDGWQLDGERFNIGGRGIALSIPSPEVAKHLVNPGEPTEFLFLVRNTGTTTDTVTVAANDPAAGWTARVLGGGRYFLAPGGLAIGTVEVIPPPQATSGQQAVTLTASSSFADVTNPPSITFTAQLTDAVVPGLEIYSDSDQFNVRPGVTKSFAVTVRNTGTARDSVVVIPSFPSNVQGWTIKATPSSAQIVAGGIQPIQIQITPSASAPSGFSFPLGLSVVQVGNASLGDRVDVTVAVLAAEGLIADVFDGRNEHALRAEAPECTGLPPDAQQNPPLTKVDHCEVSAEAELGRLYTDTDRDRGTLFHLVLQNQGALTDRYKVDAYWDTSVPGTSAGNNGVPTGWAALWQDEVGGEYPGAQTGVGQYSGFSGYIPFQTAESPLEVPAFGTTDAYVELVHSEFAAVGLLNLGPAVILPGCGYHAPGCSEAASLKVRFTSLTDATRSFTIPVTARMTSAGAFEGPNRYSGGQSDVDVAPATGALTQRPALVTDTAVQPAIFDLVATNQGNEHDGMRIAVTGAAGWTHEIVVGTNVPASVGCEAPQNNGATVVCPVVGSGDEVHFQVKATPVSAAVGARDAITVTVFSTDTAGEFDTQALEARAAGILAFAATSLGDTERTVQLGQSVAFPILVENQGTQDDSYRVTVTQAEGSWRHIVSSSAPVFIPADHEAPVYVSVTPPSGAAVGSVGDFTVQVESVASFARRTFQFAAQVIAPSQLRLSGGDGQDVLLGQRGVFQDVTVNATLLSGAGGDSITFVVDKDSLPLSWTVEDLVLEDTLEVTQAGQRPTASATFRVKAPAEALGNARAILHVAATTSGGLAGSTDIGLNLESTEGVLLQLVDNATQTQVIAAGGPAVYNLTVKNVGLGTDGVILSHSALPAGWSLVINPASSALGPLQQIDVTAKLTAPTTAKPKDVASVVVFASSVQDPVQISSQVLKAEVGYNALKIEAVGDVPSGAPQETLDRVLNVTNVGTLPDEVQMAGKIDTTGLSQQVNLDGGPVLFTLAPGQTKQVRSSIILGNAPPSDSTIQWTVTAKSLLDARPVAERANASLALTGHVLPYASNVVNDDSIVEYAVDRNDDASDGFEEFRASTTPGAKPLQSAQLAGFLRDEVRESFERDVTLANGTTVRILVYTIDGDEDGKVDHFLDKDGDGQPDFYWDPDANKASPIEFRKDINGDQVPESFVDTDGDGEQDAVFDLTRGTFMDVIKLDVDGDCQLKRADGQPLKTAAECLDYVIDRDGDGQADQDETVLYTRTGGLLIVQKVDVDGNDRLDQVFDTDGDGNPDHFIPDGSDDSVDISMRDVNGDGVQDWTFDGDGDGRKESYYDPVTGKAHVIDAAGHFVDALKQYWYVGALFALVLVLFVALVMVTRR